MVKFTKEKIITLLVFIIFIALVLIFLGLYIYNFYDHKISSNSSDWGAFGDYFGGTINTAISFITLFFLIKTYLKQKIEIKKNEISSRKSLKLQQLQARISASYELIKCYNNEIDRVSKIQNSLDYKDIFAFNFTGYNNHSFKNAGLNKKERYINFILEKINDEVNNIKKYSSQIDKISTVKN